MPRETLSLQVDDQLCFALYAASRAMTARYRPALDKLGLTYPQYLVLLVLWDEGPASVTRLGERLQLDSGTLSPLLRRLESNGLVSRRPDPTDDRAVQVRATPKARRLRARAVAIPREICESIATVDQTALMRELHVLQECLRGG